MLNLKYVLFKHVVKNANSANQNLSTIKSKFMTFKESLQVYYILCHVSEVANENLCGFVGECFSGIKAGDTYSMYGASEQCIDTRQQQCGVNSVGECAGDQNSNYVYRIILSQG